MTSVTITTEVFRWARERAGLSNERLATRVHIKPEKIRAWETGHEYPNFQQAQKLATVLGVPLGYLFLSHPPDITVPIADFRTLPGREKTSLSINLQDVLDDALRKRDWYREWRKSEGLPPFEFVGKFTPQSDPKEIIRDMRQVLDIPPNFISRIKSWNEHLHLFVQKVETAGILVLQNGIVGNNTRRKLSVDEFRGFALADEYAPLIFINAVDATTARIFTLAHELGHLWTGTSGISNPEITPGDGNELQIEKLCNHIAAEFLVPYQTFTEKWDEHLDTLDNAQLLSRYFLVSKQVILLRSYDLGIISTEEFHGAFQEIQRTSRVAAKGSGGDFYNNLFSRNSRRFTHELFSAINSGRLSYLDAARLLNTQPASIVNAMVKRG